MKSTAARRRLKAIKEKIGRMPALLQKREIEQRNLGVLGFSRQLSIQS